MIKCVIWDLDETVFDGTLSEDRDVALRPWVREVFDLCALRGVISTVASRNDREIALSALHRVGLMDLVVYPQISWEQKSVSVRRILTGLNLRPQDVLFVDDRAFERDEVRAQFPSILTHDGGDLSELLALPPMNPVTGQARLRMYKDEERRLLARETFDGAPNDFLKSCAIKVAITTAELTDLPRIGELLERTNQLNSAKLDLTPQGLPDLLKRNDTEIYVARVEDRYGDYGLSGVLVCHNAASSLEVRALVVSCRLMGKGIAQALVAWIARRAAIRGRHHLDCDYIATDFNRQMHLLFSMNGFRRERSDSYRLDLSGPLPIIPEWLDAGPDEVFASPARGCQAPAKLAEVQATYAF